MNRRALPEKRTVLSWDDLEFNSKRPDYTILPALEYFWISFSPCILKIKIHFLKQSKLSFCSLQQKSPIKK